MKNLNPYYLSLLVSGLLISSCGTSEPPVLPPAPVAAPAAAADAPGEDSAPAIAAPAILQQKEGEFSFQYDPDGRRDPFKSIIMSSEKQISMENLPPLQRIDLAELKLIGIVWGGFGYGAIVQTPDGKGYPIKKGTRVGLNSGVVDRITNKEVLIREKHLDIFNEIKIRDTVMELHPQKEGQE